ncbi:MAG TPA: exonuclease domain-containing protein [Steroidobacteraceae bacterium]|jgi:DNA polymerase-3 subunit epsilon|nr:exonuclease domain-containing protein [Steroidobacteraceae bacterium]
MAAAEELPHDLVFVDLETTGGNAAFDRITEVGIVRVTNGELADEWSSLVNPECPIPAYIEAFTGISNQMVADAPRFAQIAEVVRQKTQGAVLVAHNARFDYSFLRSEFLRADMNFSAKVLCTVKLSRRLFPAHARHNLDAVMERNGLTCSARHRALGDARVLHDFWFKLRRDLPEPQLAGAVQIVLGARQLPDHLPPGLADDLPEGPGVYRFFGEGDTLLYVGKGNSLRTRVCSHFGPKDAGSKDGGMANQVRRVDWAETAGELGAMLLEAEWIKTQKPLYNRRSKSKAQSYTLRAGGARAPGGAQPPGSTQALGGAQAPRSPPNPVEAVPIDGMEPAELTQCFGVFHSEKDARKALTDIAHARQLCLKVLGLEDGAGSCLAFHVGKCRGVCLGKEPLILHHTRLLLALSSLKLKAWPFPGRIALRERAARGFGPDRGSGADLHVVDHWTYLGTARSEEEVAALGEKDSSVAFDVDVYRILLRYFAKNPRLDWIDLRRAERPVGSETGCSIDR